MGVLLRKSRSFHQKVHLGLMALVFVLTLPATITAQHLVIEGFSGINTTKYDFAYTNNDRYLNFGGRIAGGFHKLQIGLEYFQDLTSPTLTLDAFGEDAISTQFMGLFFRSKLCRYPAARFGLVVRGGVGIYDSELTFTEANSGQQFTYTYDRYYGANGGVGFSFPFGKYAMIETSYNVYYSKRPEISNLRQAYKATFHSIQVGLSYNFVFGAIKDKYESIIKKKYK